MSKALNILILAGGFGTRLQSMVSDVPKPMAPINDKPLTYQIDVVRKFFADSKIYVLTHYLSEIIEEYFKNDESIQIIKESEPLGTGGSIKNAIKYLNLDNESSCLILNGDTYIRPDLQEFINSTQDSISIVGSFQKDCDRYGVLKIEDEKVVDFLEKKVGVVNSYINAGCYYFKDLSFFKSIKESKFGLENEFKKYLLLKRIGIFYYNDVFIDIGIPEDYKKMINFVSNDEN